MDNKSIYPTEVELSTSQTYRNFKQGLDQRIQQAVASRRDYQNREAAQLQ